MIRFIGCIVALALFNVAEVQAQGYIDGLMNRASESAKRKAQERVNSKRRAIHRQGDQKD
jgi:hypothetical protein